MARALKRYDSPELAEAAKRLRLLLDAETKAAAGIPKLVQQMGEVIASTPRRSLMRRLMDKFRRSGR